jgi:hypothetical protein
MTVRQPLPVIPIPLKAPDPDYLSDLGAVFSNVYDRSGYCRSIDYGIPLSLPLAPDVLEWAAGVAGSCLPGG